MTRLNDERFFLWLQEEQKGPFTADEIHVMLRGAVVNRDTQIRAKGTDTWFRIAEISFEDVVPLPAQPRERPPMSRSPLITIAVVLAACVAIFVGTKLMPSGDSFAAYNKLVLAQLKAPATAKITWTGEQSDGKLHGYVDSQNSFGAMIRSEIVITHGQYGPSATIIGPNPRSTGP